MNQTVYTYLGHMLLKKQNYQNGSLVQETRYIYDGFKIMQERDHRNNVTNEYTWGLGLPGGIGGLVDLYQNAVHYSYLYDGKGNVTALLDPIGNTAASYQYDPFGTPRGPANTLSQPMQFSTKPYDEKTGLFYYGYRFYSSGLGRWLTRDPMGEKGGLNLYMFVWNNSVNLIDPFGLHCLVYEGGNIGKLTYYDDNGQPIATYPGTSGEPGVSDPSASWEGPIPSGDYNLYPSEISEGGFFRNLLGDWGQYRVPLHPGHGTQTYGRSNFFLHGGKEPGSAGCIDIGDKDKDLFPQLKQHEGPIPLRVR